MLRNDIYITVAIILSLLVLFKQIIHLLFASGSAERQARLRDLGVQKSLQQLSTTTTGDLQQRSVIFDF